MSQSTGDDAWVLGEAEALLEMDGLREKLEVIVADLQSGKVRPVDHKTARARIEQVIQDRRGRVMSSARWSAWRRQGSASGG